MKPLIASASNALRASAAWLRRARRLVPAGDALALLSPPLLIPRMMRFSIARSAGREAHAPADDERARDPEFIRLVMDFFRAAGGAWFRPGISGVENVPAQGPALLVGNHNGGLVPIDSYFTGLAIGDHFQGRRSMYSLVHDFVFEDPLLRRYALSAAAADQHLLWRSPSAGPSWGLRTRTTRRCWSAATARWRDGCSGCSIASRPIAGSCRESR